MSRSVGIQQLGIQLLYVLAQVDEFAVLFYHLCCLLAHRDFALGVGPEPFGNILVFCLEISDLPSVVGQVHGRDFVVHRAQDDFLYELSIHTRVQEHVLQGAGNILIRRTFHYRVVVELLVRRTMIAIDDVAVLLVFVDYTRHAPVTQAFAYDRIFACDFSRLIYKQALIPLAVNKTEAGPSLAAEYQHAEGSPFVGYLVNYVRICVRKIELVKALLLLGYAKLQLVPIVEKQYGTKQGALPYSLSTNKMDISVQADFRVWHIGAVDKNNFTQTPHLSPPPIQSDCLSIPLYNGRHWSLSSCRPTHSPTL